MDAIVVIGDVVRSSAISDREQFQRRFVSVVEALNDQRSDYLSPYTVTLGDEYQAVYRDATRLLDHTFTLMADLAPQRVRVCIGVGAITTELNVQQAIGMDGPAFHAAREGIESLRETHETLCVRAVGYDVELENSAVRLIAWLSRRWRPTRWRVLRDLSRHRSVGAIAAALSVSPAAVYKNINEGGLDLILRCGRQVGQALTTKVRRDR